MLKPFKNLSASCFVALAAAQAFSPHAFAQASSTAQRGRDREKECISTLSGFPAEGLKGEVPRYPAQLDSVTIEYFESGCYGTCPSFTLTLTKNTANWDGHAYVRAKGKKKARITEQQFTAFLQEWYDGKFFAMRDDYCSARCADGTIITVTDIPESSIRLNTSEFSKRVYQC